MSFTFRGTLSNQQIVINTDTCNLYWPEDPKSACQLLMDQFLAYVINLTPHDIHYYLYPPEYQQFLHLYTLERQPESLIKIFRPNASLVSYQKNNLDLLGQNLYHESYYQPLNSKKIKLLLDQWLSKTDETIYLICSSISAKSLTHMISKVKYKSQIVILSPKNHSLTTVRNQDGQIMGTMGWNIHYDRGIIISRK